MLLVRPGERSFLHYERVPKLIERDLMVRIGLAFVGSDLVGDSERVVRV